ncbi:MAG: hypothetical protein HYY06_10895 [Deltaproteobacteria bacterium]|nr:hypothetical protein [Deltaproteobacteria bacterium]
MEARMNCPGCGAGIEEDSHFCGACGRILQAGRDGGPALTVLGVQIGKPDGDGEPSAAAAPRQAQAPVRSAAMTVLGIPAESLPSLPSAGAPDGAARTMLGVPSPVVKDEPEPPPARGLEPARTILGLQLDVGQLEEEARRRAVEAMGAGVAPPGPAPEADRGQGPPPPDGRPADARAAGPNPRQRAMVMAPVARAPDLGDRSSTSATTSSFFLGRRRGASLGLVVALMVIGVAALGTAIWVGIRVLSDSGPTAGGGRLRAAVSRSPSGDAAVLDLTLTPFVPGTQIAVLGQKLPVDAGRARFTVPIGSLAVGPNDIPAEIHGPTGDQTIEHVRVVLSYRVRPDLGGLAKSPPSYSLVFETVPQARVEVEGVALQPDPQGRLVHEVPLATALAAGPAHAVRFRVLAPSAPPEDGQVTTTLPIATLAIDRPAEGAVVEADSIECAGEAEVGATVTINGQIVALTGTRFLHRVALPELKDYTLELSSSAPGKAPQTRRVAIRRVASIGAEVAAFVATVDRSLTYARVSENVAIYAGQRASFFGKIFNVHTEAGRTTLQILVRDCPEGLRCSLWVVYAGETNAANGDWVDVHGTLAGAQSYRTTRGEELTVPKLDARFVVRSRAR